MAVPITREAIENIAKGVDIHGNPMGTPESQAAAQDYLDTHPLPSPGQRPPTIPADQWNRLTPEQQAQIAPIATKWLEGAYARGWAFHPDTGLWTNPSLPIARQLKSTGGQLRVKGIRLEREAEALQSDIDSFNKKWERDIRLKYPGLPTDDPRQSATFLGSEARFHQYLQRLSTLRVRADALGVPAEMLGREYERHNKAIEAYQKRQTEVRAKLSDYVKGNSVDVAAALQAGVAEADLITLGLRKRDITSTKAQVAKWNAAEKSLSSYIDEGGMIDLIGAVEAGGLEGTLRTLGIKQTEIDKVKQGIRIRQRAEATLAQHKDLTQAIARGVSLDTLVAAGYTLKDATELKSWVAQLSPVDKRLVEVGGIANLEGHYEDVQRRLDRDYIKLTDGYIAKLDYQALTPQEQNAAKGGGFQALETLQRHNLEATYKLVLKEGSEGSWLVANQALSPLLSPVKMGQSAAMFSAFKRLTPRRQAELINEMADKAGSSIRHSPDILGGLFRGKLATPIEAAEFAIPGLYIVRHRGELKGWEIATNVGLDLLFVAAIIKGPGVIRFKGQARNVKVSARLAGKAQKALADQLKVFKRLSPRSRWYSRHADNLQKALQAAKVADRKFLDSLSSLKTITKPQLAKLEKLSGYKGLRRLTFNITRAQDKLAQAWKAAEKFPVGSPRYVESLGKVQVAQSKLAKALDDFSSRMAPRIKEGPPPPEFAGKFKAIFADEAASKSRGIIDEIEGFLKTEKSLKAPEFKFWAKPKGGPAVKTETRITVTQKAQPSLGRMYDLKIEPIFKAARVAPKKAAVAPRVKPVRSVFPGIRLQVSKSARVSSDARVFVDAIGRELPGHQVTVVGKASPALSPADEVVAKAKIAAGVKAGVGAATSAKLRGATKTDTETAVREAIKEATRVGTELKAAVVTMVVPMTKVAVVVATRVKLITPIKIKLPVRPRIPMPKFIIPPPMPGASAAGLTLAQRKGAIGWKQGIMYKAIYPPYGEHDIVNSRTMIPGIRYAKGAKSAFLSIARVTKGRVPANLARDMGIMDIRISTPAKGRPSIRFAADPKRKTRLTPAGAGRLA